VNLLRELAWIRKGGVETEVLPQLLEQKLLELYR
jgi:hypothetical protein